MLLFNSRIRFFHVLSSSTNNFAHAQTLSLMSSLSGRMNIARVNIGFFTGFMKIKQRRISFVLGYLCMILWKISTTISIKHRILATFNIKKINSGSLYAYKTSLKDNKHNSAAFISLQVELLPASNFNHISNMTKFEFFINPLRPHR